MAKQTSIVPVERIERAIYLVRGQKVMLDSDLAELYGVETRVLVQAVKRNRDRFPDDFMFQLSQEELENWRSQIVISNPSLKMGLRRRPYAFTEHGAVMLATMLKSSRAVETSIQVVRAFVRLREIITADKDLAQKVASMEKKFDAQLRLIFDVIHQLMSGPEPGPGPKRRAIGFKTPKEK